MEFFYQTNSFAAPFFSDTDDGFITACDVDEAIEKVKAKYNHPAGLYAMGIWKSANDFHKNKKPLKLWLSSKAIQDKKKR